MQTAFSPRPSHSASLKPSQPYLQSPLALQTLLLASLSLAACAPVQMAVPDNLSQEAKAMTVVKTPVFWIFGRKKMTFGSYQMTDYHQGWTRTNKVEVGPFDASRAKQRFEFKLTPDQGKTWQGKCGVAASRKGLSGKVGGGTLAFEFDTKASLNCTFKEKDAGSWTMALSLQGTGIDGDALLAGVLTDGKRRFQVEGTDEAEGTRFTSGDHTGFSIKDEGRVLGAVQVINHPKVWMDPAAEPELGPHLALVSTALLLQPDLLEQLQASTD